MEELKMDNYQLAISWLEAEIVSTSLSLADKENNHGGNRANLKQRISILKRCIRAIKAAKKLR